MDSSKAWRLDRGEDFFKGVSFLWVLRALPADGLLHDILDQMMPDHGLKFGFSLCPLIEQERRNLCIEPCLTCDDEYWVYYLIATKEPTLPTSLQGLLIDPLPVLDVPAAGEKPEPIEVLTPFGCVSIVPSEFHRHDLRLFQSVKLHLYPCVNF